MGGDSAKIPVDIALEVVENQVVRIVCDRDEGKWGGQRREGQKAGARA
jgi:hypothetical protein